MDRHCYTSLVVHKSAVPKFVVHKFKHISKITCGLFEVLAQDKKDVRVLADQFVAPRRVDQPVVTAGIYYLRD